MNIKQVISNRAVRVILAAALAILAMAPTSAFAATAAGTVITNTATVTWAGNATGVSDTADVTVTLLPVSPSVVYTSTNPAVAVTTGVGSLTDVDVVYTATSASNGVDTFDLTWSSATDTTVSAPTFDVGNATTLELGGSMVLSVSGADITIPGLLANHGLELDDDVVFSAGGTVYNIDTISDDGTNTTITLSGSPAVTVGTPIFEQKQLTLTLTTGTLSAATGSHAMELTAESQTTASATTTVSNPTINVVGTALTINKSATAASTQPGDTIAYEIVVNNPGTANAANVVITDPIPNFTDFNGGVVNGGCTVTYSNVTTPTVFTYTPAGPPDPNVAAIRFECGNLASAGTITVGFDAVIE